MSTGTRTIYTGSTEYLDIKVTSDVLLDGQPVEISFDRQTWHTAAWAGDPGTSRTASLLVTPDNTPSPGGYSVYVRLTDTPEVPIIPAGTIRVI